MTSGLTTLVTRPVPFTPAVYNAAITDGRWPILGQVALRSEDRRIPDRCIADHYAPTTHIRSERVLRTGDELT